MSRICFFWFLLHFFLKAISWGENPSVLIQGNIEATDLKYPAVTICPKVSTRYGIAERMGNYIQPSKLSKELLSLRHDYFMCANGLLKKLNPFFAETPKGAYEYYCIQKRISHCKVWNIILRTSNFGMELNSKNIITL